MCDVIGASSGLPNEDENPFACLGLAKYFVGLHVTYAGTHIKLSCSDCIDRIMTTHGWDTLSAKDNPHTASPLQMDVLSQLLNHTDGPNEGTKAHVELQNK